MTAAMRWPRLSAGGVMFALALLLAGRAAVAAPVASYDIDQRYGSVGFSISELGLFDAVGTFRKFEGTLVINPADPARTKIDVAIDVASVVMSSRRAARLVLSPAYFDVRQYPAIRFESTAVAPIGHHRYLISGRLRVRGVTHPQQFVALLNAEKITGAGPATAYFTVTGTLHRSAFGMTANENFLSDVVRIVIHVHLTLPSSSRSHAGDS